MPATHCSVVSVPDTGVQVAPSRLGTGRSDIIIQQNGTVDVAITGTAVNGGSFATGIVLSGNPDPQTSPPTLRVLALGTTSSEIRAWADSGQTGSIRVWETY